MTTTIAAAAASLRRRETSSASLVDASLMAIERDGARTCAFISVDADGARDRARAVDAELAAGVDRGPLHGIPISLKDLVDVAGTVTTAGSRALGDRVAASDASIVTRLRDAGAIVLGRTNLHEFALGTTSEDSAFGAVRHPLDTTRSPGGSSGGSAVAVATGMGFASIGTDTGGSVRIPAAACGVVGLKARHGEIPTDGIIPLSVSLDHAGPLTRSVQDAAWLWQVLSGRPLASVRPVRTDCLRLKRLVGYFDEPLDPVVRNALDAALARLASQGVTIVDDRIDPADRIGETYADIVLPEAAAWHGATLDTRPGDYRPQVHARLLHGRTIPAVTYLAAKQRAEALKRLVDDALEDCDGLVLATLPIQAPVLGVPSMIIDPATGTSMAIRAVMLKHTQLFNMTGHPAVSLPIATPGLPVGLQMVGRETASLLDAAAACEPWLADR